MLDTARNGLLDVAGMDTLTAPSPVSAAESLKALRIKRRILPVALEAEHALFVFVDPGYETAKPLRSWGAAHGSLWKALTKRCRAVGVASPSSAR